MQRALGRLLVILPALMLIVATESALAVLAVDNATGPASPRFHRQLRTALALLERSDEPHIRLLYAAVVTAPGTITFRQMTDDRATWSRDGDPNRGHTQPSDSRPKRQGRTKPTNATIFIPESAVKPDSARWKGGLLVHELVHALDLASGRYNRDYTVRERRAVFVQNIWRHHVGYRLRVSYHGAFATMDYQFASERGAIAEYMNFILRRNDFPEPPPAVPAGRPAD
ncbi:MAG: hypothetical protein HY695_23610 [Deltaproteobacteria bacterium]|nr:hypothetical protein [Deltaproteobacteria bacterium]